MANEVEIYTLDIANTPGQIAPAVINVYGKTGAGYTLIRTQQTPFPSWLQDGQGGTLSSLAVDSLNNVFVGLHTQPGFGAEVVGYAAGAGGAAAPRMTLTGDQTGFKSAIGVAGLAVSRGGIVFVLSNHKLPFSGPPAFSISAFVMGLGGGKQNLAPSFSVAPALSPTCIALDMNDYLYAAAGGIVYVYDPDSYLSPPASGAFPPARFDIGVGARSMAFDRNNKLYVLSFNTLLVYSIQLVFSSQGYEVLPVPVATISIPGFSECVCVALDADGLVYISGLFENEDGAGIGVFENRNASLALLTTFGILGAGLAVSNPPIVPPPVDCKGILLRLDAELAKLGAIPASQAASWKSALLSCRNSGKITEAEYDAAIQAINSPTRKKL